MTQSMLEIAFEFLASKKKPVTFKEMWAFVQKKVPEASEGQISRFYKLLTLDGRFVALGSNKWDLKTNYTFKQLFDDSRGVFRTAEDLDNPLEEETPAEEDPFEDDEKSTKAEDDDEDEDKPAAKKRKTSEDNED